MHFLTEYEARGFGVSSIGGKAHNLSSIAGLGLAIPSWVVIPVEELRKVITVEIGAGEKIEIEQAIDNYSFPDAFLDSVTSHFPNVNFFAVRSSAIDEDGSGFSFAGLYESFLFVKKEGIVEAIKNVWRSAFAERVFAYRLEHNLQHSIGIAVIIQQMIDADASGVGFGINPIDGDRKTKLISAVYGLGEGLVSGELNADTYVFKNNLITSTIAVKTAKVIFNSSAKSGTQSVEVALDKQNKPALTDACIVELGAAIDKCFKHFGRYQDVEFAVCNQQVYVLQARPVTGLNKIADKAEEYVLWDNSNIIESYPGVTTPLTFSFISKSYEMAYKLFCGYMGVSQKIIAKNENVFANTLGLLNGRVYYNLKTWYIMLAMLPGYSINARFMEKMMGVKERFDIPEELQMSKSKAWLSLIGVGVKMYFRYLSMPKKRVLFKNILNKTIGEYKSIPFAEKNSHELKQLYLDFEKTLLFEWKAPLINDFFAMILFGRFQKMCEKYTGNKLKNIHNDLLCGNSDIISTKPMHQSIELATKILEHENLKQLFLQNDETEIWQILTQYDSKAFVDIRADIEEYISAFGERCIGELKLETISYTQEPAKFVGVLKSYVEAGMHSGAISGNLEMGIRKKAETAMDGCLKGRWLRRWKFKKALRNTRTIVSERENLRYERTRAFGIVREIFTQIGKKWFTENIINNPRDIFYLTKHEIFAYMEGTSVTQNIKRLIALRNQEFNQYQLMQPTAERIGSCGVVYHGNDFFSIQKLEDIQGDLKGIGCSPGVVKARVRVVTNPNETKVLGGDILIASSTDPGWVSLFPGAAGIIVERGSLLSHSAILSREMGKPCIVGVTGLLKILKTGDEIEMNGSTGEIIILNKTCE